MPSPIDVQKALSGATYPSSKQNLIELAKTNGADDEIVESLNKLPRRRDHRTGPGGEGGVLAAATASA
ncbi:DUF2795 domain-containing protein [Mycolicibacterium elephantis]|uniref:DUF2795 domain-containing protein n=1 Tax=Mycolicibacterium elephantis TaxID=81858 RepID=UPI0009EF6333|nr:DUF2795 domain-containing protein [Mycolicibacterium elephantis]